MKFLLIPYIALGFVLSFAVRVEYNGEGQDMFPTYYGSPFVFKQTSLGSSMEYFYSISGLILNILTWSIILFLFDKGIQKINKTIEFKVGYKVVIGLLIVFSTLNISIEFVMLGQGFNENMNYWYWNMEKETDATGMDCKGM
ncbi:hypothetical protein [Robertkochia solimangrovi]|uniref:hypothetical protein n=1 Tax=Robertkochia solimangrovi TaxID=2213046 RepID=UPI0011801972|nr:hypothetical protein [Robertkochia solimangrovi]TRZ42454.1 hypothetical protein DMZ48_13155 [Robertkochia solimangrovi]